MNFVKASLLFLVLWLAACSIDDEGVSVVARVDEYGIHYSPTCLRGKVDYLKFPYHGNYLSTTESFLDAFDPKFTVVCCSEKEYADPNTVETLEKRKITAYYTCDGDVTAVSDGKTLTCTQEAGE